MVLEAPLTCLTYNSSVSPSSRWKFPVATWIADIGVIGGLLVWHLIGAISSDDGYNLTIARVSADAGYTANYFRYFGTTEAPFDWYQSVLSHFAAISTAGRDNQTPLGVFTIKYRVRVDDMTSATLGTPASSPGFYDQPDVEYAQYFKAGGFAIHGNYWTPPDEFGTFTSHGCVGLLNPDAAWFWDFLGKGSTVDIHT